MINITNEDNMELLNRTKDESIDLIYCDILYGTGRKFNDYQDLNSVKKDIDLHYIPRIKEMYRILKTTGSIYLQMDNRINHWIRLILDNIFGYDNFKNEIIWVRSNGMNQKYKHYTRNTDKILFYSKSKEHKFNTQFTKHKSESRYNKIDDFGRRYMIMSIMSSKNYIKENDFRLFNDKKYYCKSKMGFAISQKKLDLMVKNGFIFEENSEGYLGYRQYLDNSKGVRLSDFWDDIKPESTIDSLYNTQKPKDLLKRIIKVSSDEFDTVADFYLGSGTTAVVCKELNRNFIGCDINSKSIEITRKRLINTELQMKLL